MAETDRKAAAALPVEQHPHEELVWEPPGPGSWSLDKSHVPRPLTRFTVENAAAPFQRGFADFFRRYGIPAKEMREAYINGLSYSALVRPDPDELGERAATAEAVFVDKPWRTELARWDAEVKPASIRRHRALAAVDVDGISTAALVDHLRDCRNNVVAMIEQHHVFNGAAMIPVGDLLAGVQEWTDGAVTDAEVLQLFAGASPISQGHCPELSDVVDALRTDARAAALLAAADDELDPAELLDALRRTDQVDVTTVRAIDEWLTLVGHRIVDGFDVTLPRVIERPAILVSALRHARAPRQPDAAPPAPDLVRERIPAEHRAEFDERLTEARLVYRLRDERGIYSDATADGLMRRAMLAAGNRLAAAGRLPSPELAFEAGLDELIALLGDASGAPDVGELQARQRLRARYTADDAPELLGDPPSPPPPLELLPPAMARVTKAMLAVIGNMGAGPSEGAAAPDAGTRLIGIAASPGRHEGPARIVHTVEDLLRVEPGDVLVAITTAESFNLAMSFAAAVVTDQGGLLGHAAITSREYGIPAVVGTHRATTAIADGTRVVVDGTTGEVSW